MESYANLSHSGDCWISDNAQVYGGLARVYGSAKVCGNAKVYDHARVYGGARVNGKAYVRDENVTDDRYYNKD